jgi:hypothetical protein
LKRERGEAMTVLQSSEGVRAALDEERATVAQLHADLAARQTQMASLVARASDGLERSHSEIYVAGASEGASAASEALKRAAADLKALRAQVGAVLTEAAAPHFVGLLATEVADAAGAGAVGAGMIMDAAGAAALAAENEALRRSVVGI